jgi:hypothetical protein
MGDFTILIAARLRPSTLLGTPRALVEGQGGERVAGDREQVASIRINNNGRCVSAAGFHRVFREDGRDACLKTAINRESYVTCLIEKCSNFSVIRLVAMAKQWDKFTIVAANRLKGSSRQVVCLDDRGMIVETAQPSFRIALDVRSIGRAPVQAGSRVP